MVIDLHARRTVTPPVSAGECVILTSHLRGADTVLTDANMLPVLFRVKEERYNNTTKLGIMIGFTFVPLANLEDISYEVVKDYKAHRDDFSPEIAGDNAAGSF